MISNMKKINPDAQIKQKTKKHSTIKQENFPNIQIGKFSKVQLDKLFQSITSKDLIELTPPIFQTIQSAQETTYNEFRDYMQQVNSLNRGGSLSNYNQYSNNIKQDSHLSVRNSQVSQMREIDKYEMKSIKQSLDNYLLKSQRSNLNSRKKSQENILEDLNLENAEPKKQVGQVYYENKTPQPNKLNQNDESLLKLEIDSLIDSLSSVSMFSLNESIDNQYLPSQNVLKNMKTQENPTRQMNVCEMPQTQQKRISLGPQMIRRKLDGNHEVKKQFLNYVQSTIFEDEMKNSQIIIKTNNMITEEMFSQQRISSLENQAFGPKLQKSSTQLRDFDISLQSL
ncbi:UNKNOWN [Stylonychia lemnae]|uniref:Uncharacterized protein n=1 Tax=Stylonychia lemnae TaxID=5949 RepID=A0A078AM76_STYLE|nr:UNKNOWN [Stylonychia lemnae]|eukprot:CDW82996.1 UNKNOWN [Stylonychia lemnae]